MPLGVLDPHLGQAPGLGCGPPDDGDSSRRQPGVLGADIPDLDPDHHRLPGRAGRVPGDLEQARAKEEHHPGIVRRAELPVDGKAQRVAVEAATAVQVAGPHQDPAAQNVHTTISAARGVTRQVNENARSPAAMRGSLGLLGRRRRRAERADLRAGNGWQAKLSPVGSGGLLADQLACR
jgi:hypothetical protein